MLEHIERPRDAAPERLVFTDLVLQECFALHLRAQQHFQHQPRQAALSVIVVEELSRHREFMV